MAATGLEGVWGFEQLDKTGMPTWKLALVIIPGCMLLHGLLFLLVYFFADTDFNAISHGTLTIGAGILIWMLFGFSDGVNIIVVIFISRYIQQKTETALPDYPRIADLREFIKPKARMVIYSMLFVIAAAMAIHCRVFDVYSGGFFDLIHNYGSLYGTMSYGILLTNAVSAGYLLATLLTASVYLTTVARRIPLDILAIDRYAWVCNLAVIVIFLFSIAYAWAGAMEQVARSSTLNKTLLELLIYFIIFMVFLIYYAVKPVLIMHARIVKEKTQEKARVRDALSGRREVLRDSPLHVVDGNSSRTELLVYYTMLDSLPEWPLGPHLYKLIFYVLLPPVTWALAALLQKAMF